MRHGILKFALMALVVSSTLTACRSPGETSPGTVTQVTNLTPEDIARALDMKVWRFNYTVPENAPCTIGAWLEVQDATSTRTLRTIGGTAIWDGDEIGGGGNLIISLRKDQQADPYTTQPDTWRFGYSHNVTAKGRTAGSNSAILEFDDPFHGVGARTFWGPESVSLELDKDIVLLKWEAGVYNPNPEKSPESEKSLFLKIRATSTIADQGPTQVRPGSAGIQPKLIPPPINKPPDTPSSQHPPGPPA